MVTAISVAVVAAAALGVSDTDPVDASEESGHVILFPVDPTAIDQLRWTDTWGAARGRSRGHIGVDLLGPKMTPLVAVADGEITWGRFSNGRGSIVRFRDDAGWEYQYIHINNDRPGTDDGRASCRQALSAKLCDSLDGGNLRKGVRIEAGEVIAFLGDSGNAERSGAHLHFEVYRPTGRGGVVAVNPTPFVDAAAAAIANSNSHEHDGTIDDVHHRLEGGVPTSIERAELREAITDDGLAAGLALQLQDNPTAASIERLYFAVFQRSPDSDGWDYWVDAVARGERLEDVGELFAQSSEFKRRYGGETFSTFLDHLYRGVLGRSPDAKGKRYWLDRLEAGELSRGDIVVSFSESDELRRRTGTRTELTLVHRALDRRPPTDDEVTAWTLRRSKIELEPAIAELIEG